MLLFDSIAKKVFADIGEVVPPHPFHSAAKDGQLDVLGRMLDQGTTVDVSEHRGITALMLASCCKRLESVRFLLEHGADPNAQSDKGGTPLLFAVGGGSKSIIRELLSAGADANAPYLSIWPHTPLISALRGEDLNVEILQILLKEGADPNVVDSYNWSALRLARERGDGQAVRLLQRYGAILSPNKGSKPTAAAAAES